MSNFDACVSVAISKSLTWTQQPCWSRVKGHLGNQRTMLLFVVWQVSVAKRHTGMGVWQNVRCKQPMSKPRMRVSVIMYWQVFILNKCMGGSNQKLARDAWTGWRCFIQVMVAQTKPSSRFEKGRDGMVCASKMIRIVPIVPKSKLGCGADQLETLGVHQYR